MIGPKFYLPEQPTCPVCGVRLSGAAPVNATTPPSPGDFTVCVHCATVLCYAEGLRPRVMTQEDRDEIQRTEPDILVLLDEMARAAQMHLQETSEIRRH